MQRLVPTVCNKLGGPRFLVEPVAQREERGQRVELVLAFEDEVRVVGRSHDVILPIRRRVQPARRWWLERVAVRELDHVLGLRVNRPKNQAVKLFILAGERLVRRELVRRIAQPFRSDVTRHHEGLRALPCPRITALVVACAIDVPRNGGIECVWQRIAEELRQILVLNPLADLVNHLVHDG